MDESDVLEALRRVEDPDLGDDIVSLNLVNDVDVDGETVHVDLALGAPYSPTETAIADRVREVLSEAGVEADLSASVDRGVAPEDQVLPGVKNVIAVASGKGGVGKS
ncbi:MAG: iron-sulfur cluster assembly protein, partial [Haloarculaceae archaeon]